MMLQSVTLRPLRERTLAPAYGDATQEPRLKKSLLPAMEPHMLDWLQNLPVIWMSVVVVLATGLVTAGIHWLVMTLAVGERARAFKGVSPGMLSPLGICYGLLVAFVAAQVWSDFDAARDAVNREASALRGIVLLASRLPSQPELRLHTLVRHHVENTVRQEWPAMARQRATLTMTSAPLAQALQFILSFAPANAGQRAAQRSIIAAIENALDARRQRILISGSAVNAVKWSGLLLQAVCLLIAIAMVHVDNRLTAAIAMALFATGIAVSIVLIASHNRPFSGAISVKPDVLLQVLPDTTPSSKNNM